MNSKLRNPCLDIQGDMFDPDMSAAITATGRELLSKLQEKVAMPRMTVGCFSTPDVFTLLTTVPSLAIHPDHYRKDDPWWPPEVSTKVVIGLL